MASLTTKKEQGNQAMADERSSEDNERARRDDDRPQSGAGSSGGGGGGGGAVATAGARPAGGGGGFFTIYKRGQGYWTRMGTAIGAALLAFMFAEFVHERLQVAVVAYGWRLNRWAILAISAGVFIGLMLWAWRMMNKPRNADFLIATDSEMKKVNWTTRKELIGSTKVVIFFVILISLFLFSLDVLFGYFFQLIKVLEFGPFQ
jgi:preprotein translocase subunit SecE